MKRPTLPTFRCCTALVAVFWLWGQPQPQAQGDGPPPQGVSRGENFSAKPPAALFASDCTGAGCHKGPQGLGKSQGLGGLAGFLREHYTNSRQSAAALADYLTKLPSGAEPREARTPRGGKPTAAAPASGGPGWAEGLGLPSGEAKPDGKPREARAPKPAPAGRTSRATARPDDDPAASAPAATPRPPADLPTAAEPAESKSAEPKSSEPKPAETAAKPPEAAPKHNARAQRGRHPGAAATAAAPAAAPESEAAPPASAAAPPPPSQPAAPAPASKEFDIFD